MNHRLTWGLVIALIGLTTYVYLFERRGNSTPASEQIKFYDATYGEFDLVELKINSSCCTAHFVRTDDTPVQPWAMIQPAALSSEAIDQVLVNGAAVRLAQLTADQVITGVVDLAQYGLDPPELTVTLTISSGQILTLYTGQETPVANKRYVRPAGSDRSVYLVFDLAVEALLGLLASPPLAPTPLPTITPRPANP